MAVETSLISLRREQWLIVADGSDIVHSRNVVRGKYRYNTGSLHCFAGINRDDLRAGIGRTHRPHFEHVAPPGDIVDIKSSAGHVTNSTFVREGAARVISIRARLRSRIEQQEFFLSLAAVAAEEFLEETHDKIAAICGAGSVIIERRELRCEHSARVRDCLLIPFFPGENRLGSFRTRRDRRHATECKAGTRDDVRIVRIDDECRGRDADVELAALADLV